MIRPGQHVILLLLLPTMIVPSGVAHAQEQSHRAWVTSWATTIYVARAPTRPTASGMTTASLPPIAAKPPAAISAGKHDLEGIASFYWQDQKTANGETFDKTAMTAAHRTLPFGTRVRVTNIANGHTVVVRINDCGPFKAGRVIDVSDAAAGVLGFRARGLTPVRVEVVTD